MEFNPAAGVKIDKQAQRDLYLIISLFKLNYTMQRFLIIVGIALLLCGLAWPWLSRLPLGRLPGDIRIVREGFVFYFPLTTSVLVSLVITLLLWIFRR